MTKYIITIKNDSYTITERRYVVKSEAAMWNALRAIRDSITDEELAAGIRATVFDFSGVCFKDIRFRRNINGKIMMPNAVKGTRRSWIEKQEKLALIRKLFNFAA